MAKSKFRACASAAKVAALLGRSESIVCAPTQLEHTVLDLPRVRSDGQRESANDKHPYVVLRYFKKDWECFSDWQKEELKQFSNFLELLSRHTWESVYRSGGRGGGKAGLGYTRVDVEQMKSGSEFLRRVWREVPDDVDFFELRVSQKMRVHGFQSHAAFCLVLLDREHRVFS